MSGATLPRRISFDKQGVGRTIKDSKQKATWKFTVDGDKGPEHEVILVYTFSTKKAELLVDRQHIHMSQLGEADIASRTSAVGEILQNAAVGNTLFSHVFYISDVEVRVRVDAPTVTAKDPFQITIDGRDWSTLHARDAFSVKMDANTEIHLGSGRRKSTRRSVGSLSEASAPTQDLLVANAPVTETRKQSDSFDPFNDSNRGSVGAGGDGFDSVAFQTDDGFGGASAASVPTNDGFGSVFEAPPPAPQSTSPQAPLPLQADPFGAAPPTSPASTAFPGAVDLTAVSAEAPAQRGSLTASDLNSLYASGGTNTSPILGMVPGVAPGAQAPPPFVQTQSRAPAQFPLASPSSMAPSPAVSTPLSKSPPSRSSPAGGLVDLGSLSLNESTKKGATPQRGPTANVASPGHMWSSMDYNPAPRPPMGGSPMMNMSGQKKSMPSPGASPSYQQYQQYQQQQQQQHGEGGKDAFEGLLKL